MDKRFDSYFAEFSKGSEREHDLLLEVREMEANSEWIHDVPSACFSLTDVDTPIFAAEMAENYHLNPELTKETAETGSKLILTGYGPAELVRQSAIPTIMETAKMYGSAFSKIPPAHFAKCLNYGFSVAKGKSLVLKRRGKVSAVHSDGLGGYAIMPISELLDSTISMAKNKFGEVEFLGGYSSNEETSASWILPEAKDELNAMYQQALGGSLSRYAVNFMPGLRFCSSDTAISAATLVPVFYMGDNRYIRVVEGIRVKHSKRQRNSKGASGIDLYNEQVGDVYAKFLDFAEAIGRLAAISINHPENCVISLCKKYVIPKKYGEVARQEAVNFSQGCSLTAHDIYLAMTNIVSEAIESGASNFVVSTMDETLAKIANIRDWKNYDVGGTVAW